MDTLADRFWARVDQRGPDDCWPWRLSLGGHGYGQLKFQGRILYAHRTAYELAHGAVPEGMQVLHRCDHQPCCNPAHLYAGSHADNVADAVRFGTHRRKHTDDATRRRRTALRLFLAGMSPAAIALVLGVQRRTVYGLVRHAR